MEMSVTAVMCCALVLTVFLKIKNFFWKTDFWENFGVRSVNMENLLIRLLWKKRSLIDQDKILYHQLQAKGIPFGGFSELGVPHICAADAEFFKNVLVKHFDHFVNRRISTVPNDHYWNLSVVNFENQEWKDVRAAITPTFTTGKIRGMFPIMEKSAGKLVQFLKNECKRSEIVNLEDALGNYATDVIASVAFGIESNCFEDSNSIFPRMAKKLGAKFSPLFIAKLLLVNIFPKSFNAIFKFKIIDEEAGEFFSQVIKSTIEHREKTGERRNDFLQIMIEKRNGSLQLESADKDELDADSFDILPEHRNKSSKSIEITNDIVIANSILFIFAGHDTIQCGLMFAIYSLALYPEIQQKLFNELWNLKKDANEDSKLDYAQINGSEYLDKYVNEALRMYPPTIRTERKCLKDFHIPDTNAIIPKGTLVGFPIYVIHHDPKYYPNPKKFDPERFSPENKAKRHPYAYMPFGQGPRICIANRFALMELKAAIAHLVLKFKFEPCEKTLIPMQFTNESVLKPKGGMWLKVVPRDC